MDINWLDANYLPWLIPLFPLLSFGIITLFTGRDKRISQAVAVSSVAISFVLGWGAFFASVGTDDFGKKVFGSNVDWMNLGNSAFEMGVLLDPLSAAMLFMVSIAILMIFVYSVGYMNAYPIDDPHQIRNSRFFAYLSLFAGGMFTLVVADNLLLLFIGWEIMGLCSYLLIGFLFEKKSAKQAGAKAFMTTRAADVLMLVGIGYLFAEVGTLSFREILYDGAANGTLARLGDPAQSGFSILGFDLSAASIIGMLLVTGTLGKAAQFPFHAWLPDAMQGPTPVSAMIHAAAMVSAGVFAVIRMYPLLEAGGHVHAGDYTEPLILMGVLGSITALGAAILGVGQWDIKRVLAYSTISQLGFMVAALGIGAYVAAAFHLITHAFFKALLFMASGSVIHAMEHGMHHIEHEREHGHLPEGAEDDDYYNIPHRVSPGEVTPYGDDFVGIDGELPADEDWRPAVPQGIEPAFVDTSNDMRYMGGLIRNIPITAYTMLAGVLSLSGFPILTAGFWSKDEIIADAALFFTNPSQFDEVAWLHALVFVMLVLAATLTAFYSLRMWLLTFTGEYRSAMAEHATLKTHIDHDELHEIKDSFVRWRAEYDNSGLIQGPLVVLAFFAIFAGFVGMHPDFIPFSFLTGEENLFKNFVGATLLEKPELIPFSLVPVLFSVLAFTLGAGLAYVVYSTPRPRDARDPAERFMGRPAWQGLQNRFGLDTLYLRIFYIPFEWFGRVVAYRSIDKETIDGLLEGTANVFINIGEAFKRFNRVVIDGVGDGIPILIGRAGAWFRQVQSGRVQQYLIFVAIMLLALGLFFILQVL